MLAGFVSKNHPQQVKARGALNQVDDRETPPDLFARLHERFRFTIDAAASPNNTKLPVYFDRLRDGLQQSWAGEVVWCNPPYSNIPLWVEKAWAEMRNNNAQGIVMLLPANRTEQGWWHRHVEPFRGSRWGEFHFDVEFLRGRLKFAHPGIPKPKSGVPFGSCLVIWWRS